MAQRNRAYADALDVRREVGSALARVHNGASPSVGTGRETYTMRTTREYLRRVRVEIEYHAQMLERLTRLARRYERKLQRDN